MEQPNNSIFDDLVLISPTYNTLEFLKLFVESWRVFASRYRMIVVVDGSTDGTDGFLEAICGHSGYERLSYISFGSNKTQPWAYNAGIKSAIYDMHAKYVCVLNDDMVFGPNWDLGISNYLEFLDSGNYIILNLSSPCVKGLSAVSHIASGNTPSNFNIESWATFCNDKHTLRVLVYEEAVGPGLPFIASSVTLSKYYFDYIYKGGGCLDTDWRFSMALSGGKYELLRENLIFHFSNGSTKKILDSGSWVEHGGTFFDKWGIGIGVACGYVNYYEGIDDDDLVRLRNVNDCFLNNRGLL